MELVSGEKSASCYSPTKVKFKGFGNRLRHQLIMKRWRPMWFMSKMKKVKHLPDGGIGELNFSTDEKRLGEGELISCLGDQFTIGRSSDEDMLVLHIYSYIYIYYIYLYMQKLMWYIYNKYYAYVVHIYTLYTIEHEKIYHPSLSNCSISTKKHGTKESLIWTAMFTKDSGSLTCGGIGRKAVQKVFVDYYATVVIEAWQRSMSQWKHWAQHTMKTFVV